MSFCFVHDVSSAGTELRLLGPEGPIAVDLWALEAPPTLLLGVALIRSLIEAESAVADQAAVLIEHSAIAGLTAREAQNLGLPPLTDLLAVVEGHGVMVRPEFRASLSWRRVDGQPVLGVQRIGAWLRVGGKLQRLSAPLFELAEALDRLATTPGQDMAERLAAIAALREVLPQAEQTGRARAVGLLGRITIAQADAFSLRLEGEGDALRLIPILHRSGAEQPEPLLPEDKQQQFSKKQLFTFSEVRSVYTLGDGWYVVLSPPLRRAMAEVRRVAAEPPEVRRAFAANPRRFLREVLEEEADATVIDQLFQETPQWSERVIGLGVWKKRVLPWLPLIRTDWLEGGDGNRSAVPPAPPPFGIVVDGDTIRLRPEEIPPLRERIKQGIANGQTNIVYERDGERIEIPVGPETLAALEQAEQSWARRQQALSAQQQDAPALLIKPNEEELDLEQALLPKRPGPEEGLPAALRTTPKPHQREGIAWLQKAWLQGLPGVLLADDMGLGKTLQGLAFLAWLREGMRLGAIERAPVLIVAPTGLLENWRAEHDRHLAPPGLGRLVAAHGRGLAALRRPDRHGQPALDVTALAEADWVLTTYETLRDYDRDFGGIRFAALLFDEAQKIKTPAVRVTDAAKAMNAEFRIALTGTPVENHLVDLWCIVDTVHPGCLGDLKSFTARFVRRADTETLARLRRSLDSGFGKRPPLLLRRLREDKLPELPRHEVLLHRTEMPPLQRQAYEQTVQAARQDPRRGKVLETLLKLRATCLHPAPEEADDEAFIAASARLRAAIEVLDKIAGRGERALIFVDNLAMQARLSPLLQRRYRLPSAPMIINGSVNSRGRQERVDHFQAGAGGFDVMILSPRAGGVGLTLTAANHVIHLDRWWNPAVEDQCNGRVLRIGQQRPVEIHVPMAVLPGGRRSFDDNLHNLLERKRQLMREALLPPEPTEDDLEKLLEEVTESVIE